MEFLKHPGFLIFIPVALVYLIVGWYMKNHPPQKINGLYGYRTKRSKKSQENWDFAQIYSSNELMKAGVYMLILGLISLTKKDFGTFELTVAVILVIISSMYPIITTEKKLKEMD